MNNFEFYNPVKIIFGKDQLKKLPLQIPSGQKIMMIYGGGSIKKNGIYTQVLSALRDYQVIEFGGIEPNPHYETAMKAVEIIKKENVGFLLAVGGGSVIDATKFIAAATLYNAGDPWDILAKNTVVKASLPIGTVLTLPATGSEMNMGSVITRKSTNEKFSFLTPFSFPKFSILMPEAAASLPQRQVANGIVDAYVHVIEQYLTYPSNAPLQDRFAESILLTLIEEGPKVYLNSADYNAMVNLMWCATMALNGTISCGVSGDWSVHMIGHELTAFYEIDHARTLAIVLPGIWKALRNEKKEKLLQYANRVWNIVDGSDDEKIDKAIQKTVDFFESLEIPTKLSSYNLDTNAVNRIVDRFEERKWKAIGDRQLITLEVVRKALEFQL
ncbi:MAG: iron-containing alcohol dehydrogenase [Bacteroidetes bacterium]|nr:iron-containing alcohol dehydrogenase [Bacteroidota bacterium]